MDTTLISDSSPTDRESFWLRHYELLKASGLERTEYCRQNNLAYANFGYWLKKWGRCRHHINSGLVAVKIKPTTDCTATKALCTLNLNDGRFLQIHDLAALAIILDKVR